VSDIEILAMLISTRLPRGHAFNCRKPISVGQYRKMSINAARERAR